MKSKGGTIVPTSASQPIGLATLLMGVAVGFMQGFAFSTLDLKSVERHSVPLRCKKQHGVLFYTTSTECCSTLKDHALSALPPMVLERTIYKTPHAIAVGNGK